MTSTQLRAARIIRGMVERGEVSVDDVGGVEEHERRRRATVRLQPLRLFDGQRDLHMPPSPFIGQTDLDVLADWA